jgi:D-alanine-D-alanine ligase
MRIGIAFDLKPKTPPPPGAPDDWHEEFDSPVTIQGLANVFRGLGHDVVELGNGRPLLEKLLAESPELVFSIAEGQGISRNRESRVPAVCEMLGIPYVGSDPLTLAACLDKDVCRRMVVGADVLVPKGIVITFPEPVYDGDFAEFPGMVEESEMTLPLIAKPIFEGSSKGIRSKCLIEKPQDIGPVVVSLWTDYKQGVLLEEFIAGEEVTVGIVGNDPPRIIGMMRVVPKQATDRFVYSLEVKRDWENRVDYESPPKLPHETLLALESAALQAFDILGCRDMARLDFRIRDGVPYFIEANPLPGLNPDSSDLVFLAIRMGITYQQLIERILDAALTRLGMKP